MVDCVYRASIGKYIHYVTNDACKIGPNKDTGFCRQLIFMYAELHSVRYWCRAAIEFHQDISKQTIFFHPTTLQDLCKVSVNF